MTTRAHEGRLAGQRYGLCVLLALVLAGAAVVGQPAEALEPGATGDGGDRGAGAGGSSVSGEVGTADWRQVSAGGEHTCAIRTSGRLYCWGGDRHGQLGNGGTNADQSTPTEVAGGAADWAAVTAGFGFTCARKTTGRLYCWGDDSSGQLGDGGSIPGSDQASPIEVAGGATDWAGVDAGTYHVCARTTTGRLYCWGDDSYHQLGDGSTDIPRSVPTAVAGGATNWANVSAGSWHTCARRTTGRLYCWGANFTGQLGNGSQTGADRAVPTEVAGNASNWAAVTTGGWYTCARKRSGRLFCWGPGGAGQLGNGGTNTYVSIPIEVAGGSTDWATVTTGYRHTCARRTSGRLFCWGHDGNGQLGNGGTATNVSVPVEVAGGATNWATLTAGDGHTCARRTSGRLFCWGRDGQSQLGDGGTDSPRSTPTEVAA